MLISEKSRTFAALIQNIENKHKNVIDLARHIEILLLNNDCVIVPGLGGFMAHHVDARYDMEDGLFLPPLRTLGFNPQLKINDSLLVQSYIEAFDISYPEAQRRIEDEVDELRQHLEKDGYYELNDIGVLSLNDEGHLEFEPCEAGILTPGYYGLGTVSILPLAAAESAAAKKAGNLEEQEEQENLEAINTTQMTADIDEQEDLPEEGAITIKMSWLRNIAAVAAAVIAFLMIGTPVSNSNKMSGDAQQSAFIPTSSSNHAAVVPTDAASQPSATEDMTGEASTTTSEGEKNSLPSPNTTEETAPIVQPTAAPAAPAEPAFCIVLASQVSKKGAENYVKQLHKDGYTEARVVVSKNKIRRVVYGSYSTEDDARSYIRTLRSKSRQFREAWVLKN